MDTTKGDHAHFGEEKMDHAHNHGFEPTTEMHPREMYVSDEHNTHKEANAFVSEQVEINSNEADEAMRKKFSRVNATLTMVAGWSFGVLTLLFLAFIVFGILYSGVHYHGESWHNVNSNTPECVTPFGSIIGVTNGVFAYSNCNEDYSSKENSTLLGKDKLFTGLGWQCVEFARRYWMLRGTPVPASFEKVAGAADIWSLTSVQLLDGSTKPLLKYANNVSARDGGSAPRVGDLLIYPRQEGGFPFGHVAVVVAVKSESLLVAEQNWDNKVWPAPHHNYSREIPMHHNTKEDIYEVAEADKRTITGWVRYAE
ncbi:D-alanyl-glycyl endopeptidase-like protein [Trypanosoma conorhini]|uniref:D-alanyl-glycyl endopeptidase-like protein n=1 Tax=Trypanosoma conorhini TaxID=83891 RepID=A0A3R7N0H0_9TRYP|nr:D-alanyl-glycyl endopeptidase-like protein [Trypanosoma conorhini]RNF23396.1 D-alanyl-glycyl endopeptidase-like protein [Trypanosoma conorhini]